MPGYHWKGVTAQGVKIEGDINAASKEGALEQLRRQKITVREIVETSAGGVVDTRPPEPSARGGGAPRFTRFKSLFIAALFAAAAVAVGYMAPITVWTCSREPGGAVACSISESNLGLIELRSQRLADASSVSLETQTVPTNDRSRTRIQERIVFQDAKGGSIRSTTWDQGRPREWFRGPRVRSTTVMFEEFQRFFRDGTGQRQSTWGMFYVPLILVAVLLLLAFVSAALAVLSMFVRPEWAQAQVDALRNQTKARGR